MDAGTTRGWMARTVAAAAISLGLSLAPSASARETFDLTAPGTLRFDGALAGDETGGSVDGIGDVNGDGIDDIGIGAATATGPAGPEAGAAYVIYGRAGGLPPVAVDLADSNGAASGTGIDPADGFRIDGAGQGDDVGQTVAGVGDVDGDGIDDIAIDNVASNGEPTAVLYGRRGPRTGPVDLGDTNGGAAGTGIAAADGFGIAGSTTGWRSNISVAGAGDTNGDGVDDLILGSREPYPSQPEHRAYVLYGRRGGRTGVLDPTDTNGAAAGDGVDPADGYRIDGVDFQNGTSVANLGDLNGDGKDDVALGAPRRSVDGHGIPGVVYVLYGRARSGPVDLNDTNGAAAGDGVAPEDGFQVNGAIDGENLGIAVAGGDLNGDGVPDLIIGSPRPFVNGRNAAGVVYVLYGRARVGPVDLSDTNGAAPGTGLDPADGYRLDGVTSGDYLGFTADNAGDVNGDGIDDMVIGTLGSEQMAGARGRSVYLWYGRTSPVTGPIDLTDTNGPAAGAGLAATDGFEMTGAPGDALVLAVAGAGDVDSDGTDDLLVSFSLGDFRGREDSGSVFLVKGIDDTPSQPPTAAPITPSFPPPAIARDTIAPAITESRFSTSRFSVDARAQASAARAKRGTRLALRLSEPATVVFVTEQRVGKRWRKVRIFGARFPAGRSSFSYSGKIRPRGRQRALRPGRYRLRMRPSDRAGNRGKVTTLGFTIVRR